MMGTCRLCGNSHDLQNSHIVPAFVINWLKDTSPTPFLRESRRPNKRVQDGVKRFWLCAKCEQLIGNYERQFAISVFYPVVEKGLHRIFYGDWLLKFCVSVSWRNLLLAYEEHEENIPQKHKQLVREALGVWNEFLLGGRHHPGRFEQHFIPFGTVDAADRDRLPVNINRYLLRCVEIDIAYADDLAFSYVKMGPVSVLGFFDLGRPTDWPSSKAHVTHGAIWPKRYSFPFSLWKYWEDRARQYGTYLDGLSNRQREIADNATIRAIESDKEKTENSHWFKAMQQDRNLFGDRASNEGWPSDPKAKG